MPIVLAILSVFTPLPQIPSEETGDESNTPLTNVGLGAEAGRAGMSSHSTQPSRKLAPEII
jgi:hypothetical protein